MEGVQSIDLFASKQVLDCMGQYEIHHSLSEHQHFLAKEMVRLNLLLQCCSECIENDTVIQ